MRIVPVPAEHRDVISGDSWLGLDTGFHAITVPLLSTQVFMTPTHIGVVMDCANGGDLHAYITRRPAMRLREDEARWFFQQLVVGLDYCHRWVQWPGCLVAVCNSHTGTWRDVEGSEPHTGGGRGM